MSNNLNQSCWQVYICICHTHTQQACICSTRIFGSFNDFAKLADGVAGGVFLELDYHNEGRNMEDFIREHMWLGFVTAPAWIHEAWCGSCFACIELHFASCVSKSIYLSIYLSIYIGWMVLGLSFTFCIGLFLMDALMVQQGNQHLCFSAKEYTGPKGNCRVLATAWADGLDFAELPQHLRHRAVRLAAEACLVQLLITGFVHADPHEGLDMAAQ